ncbi:hypothetical protein GQ44DRAFT_707936 [Phaeosphaeriaceae sp. PMI808]|nr:hypothetical protein GQ44DRAFT_707936 [Phaeosphaeriaceae sp. PMI808]
MKFTVISLAAFVGTIAASPAANPNPEIASSAALERRATPILEFSCADFPAVCKTQCYGAYCANNGDLLQFDVATTQEKRNRRKQAGCVKSGGNRCSIKKQPVAGLQCDEYPYASSKPKVTAVRLNKCVLGTENSRQGGKLSAFYASTCKGKACDFQIKMTGGGDICSPTSKGFKAACAAEKPNIEQPAAGQPAATPTDTSDDGSDDNSAKRSIGAYPSMRRYVTSSGREVELSGEHNIGRSIYQVVARNETLHEEQINGHVFDPDDEEDEFAYMHDNLEVKRETIVNVL